MEWSQHEKKTGSRGFSKIMYPKSERGFRPQGLEVPNEVLRAKSRWRFIYNPHNTLDKKWKDKYDPPHDSGTLVRMNETRKGSLI